MLLLAFVARPCYVALGGGGGSDAELCPDIFLVMLNGNVCSCEFFGHVPMLTFVGVNFFGHVLTQIRSCESASRKEIKQKKGKRHIEGKLEERKKDFRRKKEKI